MEEPTEWWTVPLRNATLPGFELTIGDARVDAMLTTQGTRTLFPRSAVKHAAGARGPIDVEFTLCRVKFKHAVYIAETKDAIIGLDFLKKYGAIIHFESRWMNFAYPPRDVAPEREEATTAVEGEVLVLVPKQCPAVEAASEMPVSSDHRASTKRSKRRRRKKQMQMSPPLTEADAPECENPAMSEEEEEEIYQKPKWSEMPVFFILRWLRRREYAITSAFNLGLATNDEIEWIADCVEMSSLLPEEDAETKAYYDNRIIEWRSQWKKNADQKAAEFAARLAAAIAGVVKTPEVSDASQVEPTSESSEMNPSEAEASDNNEASPNVLDSKEASPVELKEPDVDDMESTDARPPDQNEPNSSEVCSSEPKEPEATAVETTDASDVSQPRATSEPEAVETAADEFDRCDGESDEESPKDEDVEPNAEEFALNNPRPIDLEREEEETTTTNTNKDDQHPREVNVPNIISTVPVSLETECDNQRASCTERELSLFDDQVAAPPQVPKPRRVRAKSKKPTRKKPKRSRVRIRCRSTNESKPMHIPRIKKPDKKDESSRAKDGCECRLNPMPESIENHPEDEECRAEIACECRDAEEPVPEDGRRWTRVTRNWKHRKRRDFPKYPSLDLGREEQRYITRCHHWRITPY